VSEVTTTAYAQIAHSLNLAKIAYSDASRVARAIGEIKLADQLADEAQDAHNQLVEAREQRLAIERAEVNRQT
jgi:hypothetical protein